jgi:glycosyltransferase involved in cell wall biosynthesis
VKVALLSDWYLPRLGGLELHIRDLAQGLAARGCEVHIVTPNRAAPEDQAHGLRAVTLPPPRGVVVHRLEAPLFPRYKFVFTPGALREIDALFRRERYDVVHAMVGIVSPAAMGGASVARRLEVPLVVTFHSMLSGFRPLLRALDLASGWSRWPARFSAVSDVVAAEARKLVPGGSVEVLPNGVDPEAWRVEHVPRTPGELRLASVMRLNPRKRGAALLRAVARAWGLLGGDVRLGLTLVGDGPHGAALRRLSERLGLSDVVRFAGYLPREEVRDVLARSDVFVLASRLESFGIAALEARAAGVPVVALDRGGVKEFVLHGRDGLLAGSDRELSDHLVRLARDPSLLDVLTDGARRLPVPCSWDDAVARHLTVYRGLLGRREAPSPRTPRRSSSPPPSHAPSAG